MTTDLEILGLGGAGPDQFGVLTKKNDEKNPLLISKRAQSKLNRSYF
jgi:hypothetical protein